ncbi:MAG: hypothetical protein JNJ46_02565 [Myxococcales bacterium]|nr:hypothetical protein [Myxococcales bacterium]
MSPSTRLLGFLCGLIGLGCVGCQKQPERSSAAAAQVHAAASASKDAAASDRPSQPVPPEPAPAREPFVDPLGAATLELSGAVVFPPGAPPPGRVFVLVSPGDCLDAATTPLRRMPATEDGAFILHALATPGSELTVCAFVQAGSSDVSPALFYGQSATRIRVEKTDDLVLRDLQVPLRAGPPRRFAAAPKSSKR